MTRIKSSSWRFLNFRKKWKRRKLVEAGLSVATIRHHLWELWFSWDYYFPYLLLVSSSIAVNKHPPSFPPLWFVNLNYEIESSIYCRIVFFSDSFQHSFIPHSFTHSFTYFSVYSFIVVIFSCFSFSFI